MKTSLNFMSRIRIEHLWAIAVLVGIFIFLNTHPIRPQDYWWHMAIGRDIVVNGSIPTVDIYSYTRTGTPYLSYYQFWLMEVAMYTVYRVGGPVFTVLFQTAMIFPAYLLLLWICYRITRNWRASAFGIIFAFALGFGNWNVRPQAISYLLGVLILWAIAEFKLTNRYRLLLILPVVLGVWVNSHGSFPIGLAIIGIWSAENGWNVIIHKRTTSVWDFKPMVPALVGLCLAVLGCIANPLGIGIVRYLSLMAGNNIVQNFVLEWQPPAFDSIEGIIFYCFFMGSVVLLAVSPKRPTINQILFFLIFGILGLRYMRGVVWYGIVMAPIVADHLAAVFNSFHIPIESVSTPQTRRINLLFAGLLSVLAILSLPWFKQFWPVVPGKAGLISPETPIQATQFMLDNHLSTEVFHEMSFGSYLMWAAFPQFKVFVDSRIELYPPQIWDDYFTIGNARSGWEEQLDAYGIRTLMLEPVSQASLINAANSSIHWKQVFQDNAAVIFIRR